MKVKCKIRFLPGSRKVKLNVFSKNGFLFNAQNTIISAALVISGMYAVSAVLGLFRTRLLSHYYGASEILGVFYTADRIPSFIYSFLVVGTLSVIFIPLFTQAYKKDKAASWAFASTVITIGTLAFFILGLVSYIFAPSIIGLLSVGRFTQEQLQLGVDLMRIMLFGQLILVFSSFCSAILQSFRYFFVSALAPVMYNLGMVVGTMLFYRTFGIYAPAISVIVGAILHLLIQVPLLVFVIKPEFSLKLDYSSKNFKELAKLLPARMFGSVVSQIAPTINISLAVLVSTSSVVYLKNASQIQNFPVLLFGASMAQAALPSLSLESGEVLQGKFKKTFLTTFHQMMFFVLPASVLLLVLRVPVVRLAVGTPSYSWEATLSTALVLGLFSISVFSQSFVFLLNRAFYALKDTLSPVIVSVITISLSAILGLFLIVVKGYGIWSVALAYSVGSLLDVVLMTYVLSKKIGGFSFNELVMPFAKIAAASVFMGLTLYTAIKLLDIKYIDTSRTLNLVFLTVIASAFGSITYLFFTKLFKVAEVALLYSLIKKFSLKSVTGEHTAGITQAPTDQ